MNEEALFTLAIEKKPAERAAFLDQTCASDPELRRQVEELIALYDRAGNFLEEPAVDLSGPLCDAGSAVTPDGRRDAGERAIWGDLVGSVIGPYKLQEKIGEGGMGEVYRAEQREPVRRQVALKIIRPEMHTEQVIARFEAERQALAMMDHPNIAKVLDAGTTGGLRIADCGSPIEEKAAEALRKSAESVNPQSAIRNPQFGEGRPYFVMELVQGVPITKFCDDERLGLRERLELFVDVCNAIQHAHQKGIIHRDLKPSNVLVVRYDPGGPGVPKVIDFGVAKAIGQPLTKRTFQTGIGSIVGTFEYMSPEQAEFNAADIDTRSDIYSLGAVLYELLTGSTPLSHDRLKQSSFADVLRAIREEEPPNLSTRLSESRGTLPSILAMRSFEPARLRQLVRGDLDWIVMKALEKDRTRRYETAGGLARDIERHLRDEPVEAGPPSAWYRLRKFARRHKRTFVAASLSAVFLVVALIGLTVSNILIHQEQARTQAEKDRAERAQKLAEDRAEENRQGLERLKAANTLVNRAHAFIEGDQWDDADGVLTRATRLRPEFALAWEERGLLYARLGLWELAAADLAQAFELQEPALAIDWFSHALLRAHLGDLDGFREARRKMATRFAEGYRRPFAMDLIRTSTLVADPPGDTARWVERAEGIVEVEPRFPMFRYVLGVAHYRAGQDEAAVRRLHESLDLDPNWAERPINFPMLAMAYHRLGRNDEAHDALDEAGQAIDRWTQESYQSTRRDWVINQGAAGVWPIAWQDLLECQLHYAEARSLMGLPPPTDDPRWHVLRARAFAGLRRWDTAVEEYAAALQLSPHDPQILLESHRSRGYNNTRLRQWHEAAAEFARASKLQPADPHFLFFEIVAHLAAEDVDAYRQTCATMLQRVGQNDDPRVAHTLSVACVLTPDALEYPNQLIPAARVGARSFPGAAYALAAVFYRASEYDEAIRCFDEVANVYRFRADNWFFLAMAQHRIGRSVEARRSLAEGIAWIDTADRQDEDDLSGTRPAWGAWHERVTFPLLRREAEALVRESNAN